MLKTYATNIPIPNIIIKIPAPCNGDASVAKIPPSNKHIIPAIKGLNSLAIIRHLIVVILSIKNYPATFLISFSRIKARDRIVFRAE